SIVCYMLSSMSLEIVQSFQCQETQKAMMQKASKISIVAEEHDEKDLGREMDERVKEPTSRVIIYFEDGEMWASNTTHQHLKELETISPENNPDLMKIVTERELYNEKITIAEDESEL